MREMMSWDSLFNFGGEEDIGVLGVELEGFPDVGPAEGAGREGEFAADGEDGFEEREEEEREEEN